MSSEEAEWTTDSFEGTCDECGEAGPVVLVHQSDSTTKLYCEDCYDAKQA